jgi:hypothetical protein
MSFAIIQVSMTRSPVRLTQILRSFAKEGVMSEMLLEAWQYRHEVDYPRSALLG